jgi:60 kDa SS-A/Ro ribonucleoprotein
MRLNRSIPVDAPVTHEGAGAARISPADQLRRSVLSCLLWEDEFYEDGQTIADRIETLGKQVAPTTVAQLAVEAREVMHLRHVPLLLLTILIETGRGGGSLVQDTIARVIQRPDEMGELVAIYWRKGKRPLSAQMKKGLARAFGQFDEYQLAKYDRDAAVKLRDVMFLAHPKPEREERQALYKRVAERALVTPDTWEVALSAGADKRETFERLLREEKLGYLALLRNLRNMAGAGVDDGLVRQAILARKGGAHRVLPFRYVAAARACPQYERELDQALCAAIEEMAPLPGMTFVLVDVSGSMDTQLSGKSDMKRIDAAAALASMVPGRVRVFSFSHEVVEVPPRRGMAGVEAIVRSQPHGGTELGKAVATLNGMGRHDRLIVISDEQSHDRVPAPAAPLAYMVNVASAKNGIGYGKGWTAHIDGWSDGIFRYIRQAEAA